MCIFRVGMKVECIEDWWGGAVGPIVKGGVYTITGLEPGFGISFNGWCEGIGLLFSEVSHPRGISFNPARFRPIVERKTSIEVFRSLLNSSKVGEPA